MCVLSLTCLAIIPIISDKDAADFISGERTMDDFVSLSVSELKVVCNLLGCQSVTTLNKTDLVNFLSHRLFPEIEGESGTSDILLPTHAQNDTLDDDENNQQTQVEPPEQSNSDSQNRADFFSLRQSCKSSLNKPKI